MSERTESEVSLDVDRPAATAAVAVAVADLVQGGDLIVLAGDLGAGKTTFTQSFATALGVTAPVTSPTFTLANRYQGDLVVNHLDAYRIENLDEVVDLGLDDLLVDDAVTVIEWGDTIDRALPADRLEIRFSHIVEEPTGADVAEEVLDQRRRIVLVAAGPSWRQRLMAADVEAGLRRVSSC